MAWKKHKMFVKIPIADTCENGAIILKTTLKMIMLFFAGMTFVFSLTPETTADNDVENPNLLVAFTSDIQGFLEECG